MSERVIFDPLIINLAPTGMVPTRAMSPFVPLQPKEIIRDVLQCARIGITSVHIHARDENGNPTHSKEIYAKIIAGIREERPDLVICVSCSGRGGISFDQRAEVLDLKGDLRLDMASLTLSSLNFNSQASINEPAVVMGLAQRMLDRGIKPEFEIFDLGMVNLLRSFLRKKMISMPCYANLLFGNIATAQSTLQDMSALTSSLPHGTIYSFAGLGASQLPVAAVAVASAPGVRIGLEDNLWTDPDRALLAKNETLVEKVQSLSSILSRPIMTPSELRSRLELAIY